METITTQQEILLITGTSFCGRVWCEKNTRNSFSQSDDTQWLEEACWNGLLQEIIPEIFLKPADGKGFYLWQISEGVSFIRLVLGDSPLAKDDFYSIDPYSFLKEALCN